MLTKVQLLWKWLLLFFTLSFYWSLVHCTFSTGTEWSIGHVPTSLQELLMPFTNCHSVLKIISLYLEMKWKLEDVHFLFFHKYMEQSTQQLKILNKWIFVENVPHNYFVKWPGSYKCWYHSTVVKILVIPVVLCFSFTLFVVMVYLFAALSRECINTLNYTCIVTDHCSDGVLWYDQSTYCLCPFLICSFLLLVIWPATWCSRVNCKHCKVTVDIIMLLWEFKLQ